MYPDVNVPSEVPQESHASSPEHPAPTAGSSPRLKKKKDRRGDHGRLHTTRHGALAKYPLEALIRGGENLRQLRRIERMLRAELKPKGIVAEMLFDRAWSSYLRCLLIARADKEMSAPEGEVRNRLPYLREGEVPTLVFGDHKQRDVISADALSQVAIVVRYDAHFSREFFRAVGMLLALKTAGDSGLTGQVEKTFGQNKDVYEHCAE